jgi:hypothetical protein
MVDGLIAYFQENDASNNEIFAVLGQAQLAFIAGIVAETYGLEKKPTCH